MIRATRGRSMDGWMDGWMDGEVLIIGMMVGWSGGVPKSLTCGELRAPGFDSRLWGLVSIALFLTSCFRKRFF